MVLRDTQDSPGEHSFSFVAYNGPKLPQDPSVRKLIRRRAMKDIATERKQRGGYGQNNLRQYPVFLKEDSQLEDLSRPAKTLSGDIVTHRSQCRAPPERDHARASARWNQYPAASQPRGYVFSSPMVSTQIGMAEQLSLLLHHTPLPGLRLGITNFLHLKSVSEGTRSFDSASHLGNRKLLGFIPSRYGHVSSLSYATDCVVAKLRLKMHPPESRSADQEATVLSHYAKALKALQAALEDENQRMTAETLCATELLGIFELLDGRNGSSEAQSWLRHAGGTVQLIQTRGTHRFNTDFEMALFTAHIGPAVMDAFLKNKACFLAEERWKQLMLSAIHRDESLAQQRDLVLGLWSHLVGGPQRFKEVTDLISSPTPPAQSAIDDLVEQILEERDALVYWVKVARRRSNSPEEELEESRYGAIFPRPPLEEGRPSSECATQLALLGTYLACRLVKSRLLVALSPSRFRGLEVECQYLAGRIMSLRLTPPENDGERLLQTLFISQSCWMAKGIVETKKSWGEEQEHQGPMIEKWKFEAWCNAIGRKFTTVG